VNLVGNDLDDQKTTFRSGPRECAEAWEREQQLRDERFVQHFLQLKLKQKAGPLFACR
jgi:hypothetical protein